MKSFFNSNKFKHGTMASVFIVLFVAVIVVVNVIVSMLGDRFPSMDIDLTPNKLNTLSETAGETAKDATLKTEIILVGTEEQYKENQLYANYGIEYSQVASIAEKMREANPEKISVEYVDPDLNPTLMSEYASDALGTGKVLVRSEARSKVLSVIDLFSVSQNQQTGKTQSFSMVDGALANAVHVVNLDFVPVIAVATGHQEMFEAEGRASFDELVNDNGFDVVEFNLLTEEIPEDARVLFLATPNTDYSKEEIAKIEAFLDVRDEDRTLLVSSHPTQADTPSLDYLLAEWGIKVGDGVIAETDESKHMTQSPSFIITDYVGTLYEAQEYPLLLSAEASPIEFLFDANNDIGTEAIVRTSDTAYVSLDGKLKENPETASYITTGMAYRYNNIEGDNTKTHVIVTGDTIPFFGDFIGNSAFSNRDYLTDMLKYATNIHDDNVGIYVEQTETNVIDIVAPMSTIRFIGFTIFTVTIPLVLLAVGLVVFLRRRHK